MGLGVCWHDAALKRSLLSAVRTPEWFGSMSNAVGVSQEKPLNNGVIDAVCWGARTSCSCNIPDSECSGEQRPTLNQLCVVITGGAVSYRVELEPAGFGIDRLI